MATRQAEWDNFVDTYFVGQFSGLAHDFCLWLRLRDCSAPETPIALLERYFHQWSKSKRIGKHQQIMDRRRRKTFGPGRYHASTPAGVFLNRSFVKGWGGVNPRRP